MPIDFIDLNILISFKELMAFNSVLNSFVSFLGLSGIVCLVLVVSYLSNHSNDIFSFKFM